MTVRRAAVVRNTAAATLGLLSSIAGSNCNEDPPPDCDPCDAVFLLEEASFNHQLPAAIPEDALHECGTGHRLRGDRRRAWEQRACSELTALYAISRPGWAEYKDRFPTDVDGGYLCPRERQSSCIPGQSPDDGGEPMPSIVGEFDEGPVHTREAATTGAESTTDATSSGSSSESGDDGASELPPICDEPSTEVAFWGRSIGFLIDKDALAGVDIGALESPPFTDEECGQKVFSIGNDDVNGCTASLIGPRHVLTARHCFEDDVDAVCTGAPVPIEDKVLLFDYIDTPSEATKISGLRVVACGDPQDHSWEYDWVVLELPEPLDDRCPLPLPEPERTPVLCEPVYALGYPLGHELYRVGTRPDSVPTAWVTERGDGDYFDGPTFYTTLDTMDSLSGAPIFAMDGQLLGMLVRGAYSQSIEHRKSDPTGKCTILICPSVGCADTPDYAEAITLARLTETLQGQLDLEH